MSILSVKHLCYSFVLTFDLCYLCNAAAVNKVTLHLGSLSSRTISLEKKDAKCA